MICHNGGWHSVQSHYVLDIEFCQLLHEVLNLHWDKVGVFFSQSTTTQIGSFPVGALGVIPLQALWLLLLLHYRLNLFAAKGALICSQKVVQSNPPLLHQ